MDIDGTIADCSHRMHYIQNKPKNWKKFFEEMVNDKPIQPVIDLVRSLTYSTQMLYWNAVLLTGRPEKYRRETAEWLTIQFLGFNHLYMRKDGDYREDFVVKEELLNQVRQDGFNPSIAIEDRSRNVEMFRRNGLIVFQCADGNF